MQHRGRDVRHQTVRRQALAWLFRLISLLPAPLPYQPNGPISNAKKEEKHKAMPLFPLPCFYQIFSFICASILIL